MKNRLKNVRLAAGKTQAEVARDLNINLPTYRTYEQGTRRLSDERVVELATYFGCSGDEILGLASRPSPSPCPCGLREIRKFLGKSQKEVAEHLGMSEGGYSHLESGRRKLSDKVLVKLSAYFGCTTDSLLGLSRAAGLQRDGDTETLKALLYTAVDRMTEVERDRFRSLMTSYFNLDDEGEDRLVSEADLLLRSGLYERNGFPEAGGGES